MDILLCSLPSGTELWTFCCVHCPLIPSCGHSVLFTALWYRVVDILFTALWYQIVDILFCSPLPSDTELWTFCCVLDCPLVLSCGHSVLFTTASTAKWQGVRLENGRLGFALRQARWSYTSDMKLVTLTSALPGAWRYRVGPRTGCLGVSVLCLGTTANGICSFCLSVAARDVV